jgi:hypothetical protein
MAVPAQGGAEAQAAQPGTTAVPLTYQAQRNWDILLPEEAFSPVGTGWAFAPTAGHDFKAAIEGTALAVDTDGDGKVDVRVDGPEGMTKLRGTTPGGAPFTYAVRLRDQSGWVFGPAGFVTGRIGDTRIRIIDQNNNGSFDDVGQDAMIVGTGRVATFLSDVVSVEGQAYRMRVTPDGSSLSYSPFEGDVGTLKVALTTSAKVLSVVVKSTDGRRSFELSGNPDGLTVPAGRYVVHRGELGLGANRLGFRQGRARALSVDANGTTELTWGGPVQAEFAYQRQGDQVGLSPDAVWYYGAGGEQYEPSVPLGKSPTFTFVDKKSGQEIATAYFPGTC